MNHPFRFAIALASFLVAWSAPLYALVPPGFSETPIAVGLSVPSALDVAPDGRVFVVQLLPDGQRDPAFGNNGVYAMPQSPNSVRQVMVQSDGQIVVSTGDQDAPLADFASAGIQASEQADAQG